MVHLRQLRLRVVSDYPKGRSGDEVLKLRTLPGILVTVVATVGAAIVLAAILAAAAGSDVSAAAVTSRSVPFLHAGPILLGVLAAVVTTTWMTASPRGAPQAVPSVQVAAGATAYLVLVGLLAHAVAVLLRSLTASLATVLGLVFVASPLLRGLTAHAHWLPDQAAQRLLLPHADPVLTPWRGMLVLTAWLAASGLAAGAGFLARDA